jgi:hypothetical protein
MLSEEALEWYFPNVSDTRVKSEKTFIGLQGRINPIFDIHATLNDVAVWSHVILKYWIENKIKVGYFAGEVAEVNSQAWVSHAKLYKDAGRNKLISPEADSSLVSPFNVFRYFMHFRGLRYGLANTVQMGVGPI